MRFITSLLVALAFLAGPAAASDLTPRQAGELFAKSVVKLTGSSSDQANCTGSMIGDKLFLSAGHCAGIFVMGNGRIRSKEGYDWVGVKSFTLTTQKKADGKRYEDWLLLNSTDNLDGVEPLTLGCTDTVYVGMPIAYAGYPAPIEYGMGLGHIMSVNPVHTYFNNLDFVIDVHAAPGASGSPVINLETGHVIGVLTEGVPSRVGFFAVGIEHISNLDLCDEAIAKEKKADEGGDPVLGNPDELASPF